MIFGPMARDKGIEIRASIQGVRVSNENTLPVLKLVGDARRIKQILMNLVRNSIKFTSSDFILISSFFQADE